MSSFARAAPVTASSVFIGAWKWASDRQIVYADEGMSEFFGFSAEDGAVGISSIDLRRRVHLDDRARIGPELIRAADNHRPFSITYRVVTPTQGIRQVRSFGRPQNSRGPQADYVGGILDIGSGSSVNTPLIEAIDLLAGAREHMALANRPILSKLVDAVLLEAGRELNT